MSFLNRVVNNKYYFRIFSVSIGFMAAAFNCFSLPQYNIQDTQPFYTVMGSDKYYSSLDSNTIQINFSPYHQHAKSGREASGKKVAIGDIYGKWNMFGVFFGDGGRPAGKITQNLGASRALISQLNSVAVGALLSGNVTTADSMKYANIANYTVSPEDPVALSASKVFNPERDIVGSYDSTMVRYERVGLRTQLNFNFRWGLGFGIRSGVSDYKQRPEFNLNNSFRKEAGLSYSETDENGTIKQHEPILPGKEGFDVSAHHILVTLLDERSRNAIAKDLELDLSEVRETKWEDTHVYMSWQHPFAVSDKEGDFECSIIPYVSLGVWLPTGEEKNQDKAFSMPTGNDGFTLVTLEGALSFDFPKMIQTSFGGGVLFGNERELSNYRVPTSKYQVGIVPWKTNILKRPGVTWYVNASFKAEDFISTLSFYFDWIYTRHLKDSVTLREPNNTRSNAFKPGILVLETNSEFKNQQVSFGFNYQVTKFLAFGFGAQSYISGARVYRSTTLMGSATMTF